MDVPNAVSQAALCRAERQILAGVLRQAPVPQIQELIVVQDAVGTQVAEVLVIMQLEFQQSHQFVILKVPQIQFIDRLFGIPAAQQCVEITQVQFLGGATTGAVVDVPVICRRLGSSSL